MSPEAIKLHQVQSFFVMASVFDGDSTDSHDIQDVDACWLVEGNDLSTRASQIYPPTHPQAPYHDMSVGKSSEGWF